MFYVQLAIAATTALAVIFFVQRKFWLALAMVAMNFAIVAASGHWEVVKSMFDKWIT